MLFRVVGRLGPLMRQVVGVGDSPTAVDNFGGVCRPSHCYQWGLAQDYVRALLLFLLSIGLVSICRLFVCPALAAQILKPTHQEEHPMWPAYI